MKPTNHLHSSRNSPLGWGRLDSRPGRLLLPHSLSCPLWEMRTQDCPAVSLRLPLRREEALCTFIFKVWSWLDLGLQLWTAKCQNGTIGPERTQSPCLEVRASQRKVALTERQGGQRPEGGKRKVGEVQVMPGDIVDRNSVSVSSVFTNHKPLCLISSYSRTNCAFP